jgi:hypothetical protein
LTIEEYVTDIASQMGLKLINVALTSGKTLGCLDAYLMSVCSKGKLVSEFIHQSDLDRLKNGFATELLELKIRASLERLKILLVP